MRKKFDLHFSTNMECRNVLEHCSATCILVCPLVEPEQPGFWNHTVAFMLQVMMWKAKLGIKLRWFFNSCQVRKKKGTVYVLLNTDTFFFVLSSPRVRHVIVWVNRNLSFMSRSRLAKHARGCFWAAYFHNACYQLQRLSRAVWKTATLSVLTRAVWWMTLLCINTHSNQFFAL